jgi:betaine/carnitine transporter, BCCT family
MSTESYETPPDGDVQAIETDYEVGQDNIQPSIGPFGLDIHNPVFMISGLTIVAFVFLALALPGPAADFFGWLREAITSTFDWFFLLSANIFVLVCLGIVVSPLGRVRIGGTEATPDYSYATWFAMLFAAGMGIGLMFFGVSEPISHFSAAVADDAGSADSWAPLAGAAGDPVEAQRLGLAATIFHWGLHPWAIYAIVALALALFSFNKGLPLSMRSIFYPVFGERVWGWTGHVIDILAVFATLFGLATSLGIGAEQANAGLEFLFGVPEGDTSKVLLIIGITGVALISVMAGLDKGVRRLSEINMVLAALLLLFVVFVGPTTVILSDFFGNLGAYAEYLPALANPFGREDANFSQGWTSFYWAWWISWSPFVGMFIARVSRGRTVREFIICVLIIPSLVSVLWMTAVGGTAVHLIVDQGYQAVADAALELKLFVMLEALPLTAIASFIGIVLVIVFFVTSSDSGSLVIDTITAGGKTHAPKSQRVFWCTFEGLVAIALLLGGGLTALQAAAVSTGLPFTLVLLLGCYALIKGLMSEPRG